MASNVSVTDAISANVGNFTLLDTPDGSSNSYAGGVLTVSNITIPAGGSDTIVFEVDVSGAAGATIANTATVTNPGGPSSNPSATTLTISPGSVAGSGTKRLYLYPTSNTAGTLSRTVQTNGTSYYINRGNGAGYYMQLTLNPAPSAQLDVDNDIAVRLCMRRTTDGSGAKTVRVELLDNATAIGTNGQVNWNSNGWAWRFSVIIFITPPKALLP